MDEFDVVVLGGGPGGYVAAIRAAQLKLRTALVEREALGGVCLNWGCIPSKALLRNAEILSLFRRAGDFGIAVEGLQADFGHAVDRSRGVVDRMVKGVQFLLRKHGVTVVSGTGVLRSPTEVVVGNGQTLRTKNVIVATGARGRELAGIVIDGEKVIGSREALARRDAPASVVIIGAGAIGAEFSYIWRSYGSAVTLVEALPQVLPQEDEEISAIAEKEFTRQGVTLMTSAKVLSAVAAGSGARVEVERAGERTTLTAELALVCIGLQGNSDALGLEEIGVTLERTFVPVDGRMATNVPGVFAIGDVTGPPLLAHVASAQGVVAVEGIAGICSPRLDYDQMPRATYCQPEVASIGLTEAQAVERGLVYDVGRFPFRANGRAVAMAEMEGLAKVLAERGSGDLLGVHLIGPGVTELLGELSLARALEATPAAIGYTVHAHPTLSEVVKEAALSARGEVIHAWQG